MNLRNLAVAAIVAATATAAQQPFDLDPSFRLPVDEINIKSVLQRPDGKLIVSGQLRFPGVMAPSIGGGVLNTDGTVETYLTPDGHYYLLGGRMTPWGDGSTLAALECDTIGMEPWTQHGNQQGSF